MHGKGVYSIPAKKSGKKEMKEAETVGLDVIARACVNSPSRVVWRGHTHEREARGSGCKPTAGSVLLECN